MIARTLRLAALIAIGTAALAPMAAGAQRPRPFDDGAGYGRAGYGRGGYDIERPRDDSTRGRRAHRARDARRCDRGDGGTIIGAIAGGLLGGAVAGRGDRGAASIVGAGAGALAGRAIDRDC